MGKYTFTWEHAATEVLVTGTFDNWQKTVTLEKEDGVFKKTVELPKTHTQYKFVVDGNWVVNDTARKEADSNGIENNVLLPEDFVDEPVQTLSSAAPTSTTAALAGAVPKESDKSKSDESVPGAFPETPAAAYETPSSEYPAFSVNPIPATDGPGNPIKLAPGEPVPDPSTLTSNTIQSTVKDEKPVEEQSFGVAPLPATAGPGNPIKLAPGEPVPDPSTFTSNTVQSTVKTDAASYEKSDATPALPDLGLTPQAERDAKGDTGVTIQSAAPTSTTAALAAEVPKEPRGVPETVVESQKDAGVSPEAAANPIAVLEKKEVEQELKETVPEAPAAADNSVASQVSSTAGIAAGAVAAGAATGAGLFAAATYSAKEKAAEAIGVNGSATAGVPEVVTESQKEAHVSPEAAANTEAVAEKKAVETELLKEVPKTNEAGEPAPVASAVTSAIAPGTKTEEAAPNVPDVVAESEKAAHVSPEAAASVEAVGEKKAVEAELLEAVPKTEATGEPAPAIASTTKDETALNAPASAPAQPASSKPIDANTNVEFAPKEPATTEQSKPVVTTGTETTSTEAKTEAPSAVLETPKKDNRKDSDVSPKGTPGSQSLASGADDKKKKRRSIFGKIKDKLSSKH